MKHKRYVAGFLFNQYRTSVAVIQKAKPEWQRGKFNAIGGKIEEGEVAYAAMEREFFEETGCRIEKPDWHPFCTLQGIQDSNTRFIVFFFYSIAKSPLHDLVRTTTNEVVYTKPLHDTSWLDNAIPNLRWLIPMALSMSKEHATSFDIVERY